jgi:N-acetylglucosamine-6-phosphate deacetylase
MLMRQAPVRVLTLAPELDGALALIPTLVEWGVRVQIGHSSASYEQACAALQAGARGFTHLFNAMGGLHHRAPGVAGAALAHAQYAELIPDLVHVHPGAMRAALRAVPGLFAVTDATAAAGMPDGDYRLGAHDIVKRGDTVRLADGSLAGSVLTMDLALRNLLRLGLPLAEAARRCSTLPADHLGLAERGRVVPGAAADLVVLDPRGMIQAVLAEGRAVG